MYAFIMRHINFAVRVSRAVLNIYKKARNFCRLYCTMKRERERENVNKRNKISQTLPRYYDDNNGIFNFTLALFSRTILRAFTPWYPSEKSRFASAGRVLFVMEFRRNKIFTVVVVVVSHREDYN